MTRKITLFILAVVALAVVFAIFHATVWHWVEIHTGTVNESGPYYGFWSGFGSDLGEATIFIGLIAAYRHHTCHVKGCPLIGRQVEGTPYVACYRHHPARADEHKGKRNVDHATIVAHYDRATSSPDQEASQ